jgi:hypothetical protein
MIEVVGRQFVADAEVVAVSTGSIVQARKHSGPVGR